ncbi:LysR substrate-binding domain-containing protein [Sneathiella marina]|uniref:LysR substrate-binding domain-containing protein n=1 Tax=Sneathiella marina TaxID=2950108 RepID=A0ABY4W6Y9_9PROT|nr:LysR substrate-binding domain-containing protein [Sneathiella marina]USG62594.1 LysR substrate-binding domain-containing protein [Sneathiella marina]
MARRYYNLPPLNTLASFECAARNLSIKDAAQELNVTPGAVSHQIKALEGELGISLFERKHRGIGLTEDGQRLLASLQRSFSDVSSTLAHLRRTSFDISVTIAATTAVSSLWLTPRLSRFWKEHGGIPVNQLLSDHAPKQGERVDLRVKYGKSKDTSKTHQKLFSDHLAPICSPTLAQKLAGTDLETLASMPLIHNEADDESWTTWESWFRELGYTGDIAAGIHVNNYTIALQAAQDDAGIVLGWQRLIRPLLEQKRLIPFGPHVLAAPHSFYIITEGEDMLSDNTKILRDWLLEHI